MSIEVLRTYRFRCDAYLCTASIAASGPGTPEGWSEVSSTAHQSYGPLPSVKSGASRLRALSATGVRTYGRFTLHLCPEHPDGLSGHSPRTDGVPSGHVVVSCSCGARIGETTNSACAIWRAHFETSLAELTQGQISPIEGDQMT